MKPKRPKRPRSTPKHKTIAEGFMEAAAREQHRLDLHAEIAERLRKDPKNDPAES